MSSEAAFFGRADGLWAAVSDSRNFPRMGWTRRLSLGLLAVGVVLAQGCSGNSATEGEVTALREQLAGAVIRAAEVQADLDEARSELADALGEVEELTTALSSAQSHLERNDEQRRSLVEHLQTATANYHFAQSRLDALLDAIAPYRQWEGLELTVGTRWRFYLTLSGCGWDYLGHFNGLDWFLVSAQFEPPDSIPANWNTEVMTLAAGSSYLKLLSVIVLTADGVIEATTLWGDPVATYAPQTKPPPECGSD